jgi:hypothetical protein
MQTAPDEIDNSQMLEQAATYTGLISDHGQEKMLSANVIMIEITRVSCRLPNRVSSSPRQEF